MVLLQPIFFPTEGTNVINFSRNNILFSDNSKISSLFILEEKIISCFTNFPLILSINELLERKTRRNLFSENSHGWKKIWTKLDFTSIYSFPHFFKRSWKDEYKRKQKGLLLRTYISLFTKNSHPFIFTFCKWRKFETRCWSWFWNPRQKLFSTIFSRFTFSLLFPLFVCFSSMIKWGGGKYKEQKKFRLRFTFQFFRECFDPTL